MGWYCSINKESMSVSLQKFLCLKISLEFLKLSGADSMLQTKSSIVKKFRQYIHMSHIGLRFFVYQDDSWRVTEVIELNIYGVSVRNKGNTCSRFIRILICNTFEKHCVLNWFICVYGSWKFGKEFESTSIQYLFEVT